MTILTGKSEAVRTHGLGIMAAVAAGALLTALGAQVAVPLPGTPVPLTLQVPAVLIAGGLLGPGLGASSLALYLVLGALGLPVFAAGGVPGVPRLFGPTGGYLLAYPIAAAAVGYLARRPGALRVAQAVLAGTLLIHLGGISQLAAISGSFRSAVDLGSLPFIAGDILKMTLAGLIIGRYRARVSRLLS